MSSTAQQLYGDEHVRRYVETDGEELSYAIVGSAEADPAAGRLSSASPVGAALLGATAGAEVDVRTPRGTVRYRVVAVD